MKYKKYTKFVSAFRQPEFHFLRRGEYYEDNRSYLLQLKSGNLITIIKQNFQNVNQHLYVTFQLNDRYRRRYVEDTILVPLVKSQNRASLFKCPKAQS